MESDFEIDGKRVAIVGSRDYKVWYHEGTRYQDLSEVREFVGSLPPDVTIVSGGARGVDTAAVNAAKEFGMNYKIWEADWKLYGKQAGFIRNLQIIHDCDCIIAYWDGYSKGTHHTITHGREQGKHVIVITP